MAQTTIPYGGRVGWGRNIFIAASHSFSGFGCGAVLGLGQFWVGAVLGWGSFEWGSFGLGQFWDGAVMVRPVLVRAVMSGAVMGCNHIFIKWIVWRKKLLLIFISLHFIKIAHLRLFYKKSIITKHIKHYCNLPLSFLNVSSFSFSCWQWEGSESTSWTKCFFITDSIMIYCSLGGYPKLWF